MKRVLLVLLHVTEAIWHTWIISKNTVSTHSLELRRRGRRIKKELHIIIWHLIWNMFKCLPQSLWSLLSHRLFPSRLHDPLWTSRDSLVEMRACCVNNLSVAFSNHHPPPLSYYVVYPWKCSVTFPAGGRGGHVWMATQKLCTTNSPPLDLVTFQGIGRYSCVYEWKQNCTWTRM